MAKKCGDCKLRIKVGNARSNPRTPHILGKAIFNCSHWGTIVGVNHVICREFIQKEK